MIFFVNYPCS